MRGAITEVHTMRMHQVASKAILVLLIASTSRMAAAAEPAAAAAQPPAAPASAKPTPAPAAKPAPPATKSQAMTAEKKRDALRACTERADYIFVRRCQQACQAEAKGKDQAKARKCVQDCGTQPERTAFIDDCMRRAGAR